MLILLFYRSLHIPDESIAVIGIVGQSDGDHMSEKAAALRIFTGYEMSPNSHLEPFNVDDSLVCKTIRHPAIRFSNAELFHNFTI